MKKIFLGIHIENKINFHAYTNWSQMNGVDSTACMLYAPAGNIKPQTFNIYEQYRILNIKVYREKQHV